MALTQARNTPYRNGEFNNLKVEAGTVIYEGTLVVVNSGGYAEPGKTATGLTAAGRCEEYVDNSDGADGDVSVIVKRGCFLFNNSSSDAVTQASIMKDCYIEDDQTVCATDGTNTKSIAGKVLEISSEGVWVEIK